MELNTWSFGRSDARTAVMALADRLLTTEAFKAFLLSLANGTYVPQPGTNQQSLQDILEEIAEDLTVTADLEKGQVSVQTAGGNEILFLTTTEGWSVQVVVSTAHELGHIMWLHACAVGEKKLHHGWVQLYQAAAVGAWYTAANGRTNAVWLNPDTA